MMTARLVVCGVCRKHANIVLASGSPGPEFCFKEHGQKHVSTSLENRLLTSAEAVEMAAEINLTDLPQSWQEVPLDLIYRLELWNHVLAKSRDILTGSAHNFIEEPFDRSKIPRNFEAKVRKAFATPAHVLVS